MAVSLSVTEKKQLGSVRLRQDGTPSAHPYPTPEQWPSLRGYLVERSRKANPNLDESLTGYTPGETVALLTEPAVAAWHGKEALLAVPEGYSTIVLVPCAKTKPWVGPSVSRSKLYSAYNELRAERPEIYFATISEPLGIVPMDHWASFPQYDNPGLFRDDAQQSGMTKKEWDASPFRRWYGLPFDEQAWHQAIDQLGQVVGTFLERNQTLEVISVVDNDGGPKTTHGAMLDKAVAVSGVEVTRYPKRIEARVSPLSYLRDVLDGRALDHCLSEQAKPQITAVDEMIPSQSADVRVPTLSGIDR